MKKFLFSTHFLLNLMKPQIICKYSLRLIPQFIKMILSKNPEKCINDFRIITLITFLCIAFLSNSEAQQTRSMTFRAYIDGSDYVHIKNNEVWYEHRNWQLPGQWNGANNPTYINGNVWYPAWPGNNSDKYATLTPSFLLATIPNVSIQKTAGRGDISITQMPTANNQKECVILLDDDVFWGPEWYEFTLYWNWSQPCVLPYGSAGFTKTNATCAGTSTGSITIAPTVGSISDYSYKLQNSGIYGASNVFNNLKPGTYRGYALNNTTGCVYRTGPVIIGIANGPVKATISKTDITCNGAKNGTITINASGGSGNYLYQLGSAGTPQSSGYFNGVGPGTYRIVVTDVAGCKPYKASVTLTQPTTACSGEINVLGNGSTILDGDYIPSLTDSTDFGSINTGGNIVRTFTIENTGTNPLSVNGITLTGADASLFTVGLLTTASPIPPGGSSTFTVTFTPASGGLKTATINIANSDMDEGIYDFAIRGKGNTTCSSIPGNLVVNGDFCNGNTDFSSEYDYYTSCYCLNEGMYAVATNPTIIHGSFIGVDHTSGTGNFMIVNSSPVAGTKVWYQTINVAASTTYNFSAWVSTMYGYSAAQLKFYINGNQIGATFSAPDNENDWQQFTSSWYSTYATSATISIVNENTNSYGNDFGLDDISLTPITVSNNDTTVNTCDSFAWYGTTYVTSGIYFYPPTGDTLHLTIRHSSSFDTTITSCSTYIWNGIPYQPGTYTFHTTNAAGCDSAITLRILSGAISSTVVETNSTCPAIANGSIAITTTGGMLPYQYRLGNGSYGSSNTFTGLAAGTYDVYVQDANGCSNTITGINISPASATCPPAYVFCNSSSTSCSPITNLQTAVAIDQGALNLQGDIPSVPGIGNFEVVIANDNYYITKDTIVQNSRAGTGGNAWLYRVIKGMFANGLYHWKVRSMCQNQYSQWTCGPDFIVPFSSYKTSSSISKPDISEGETLKLAPNPARDILSIYTPANEKNKPTMISIISAAGVVVKTTQSTGSTKLVQMDISSLASGVYMIRVTSDDKVLYKQFVKL